MTHHRDDPPCPECGERPGMLQAEIERQAGYVPSGFARRTLEPEPTLSESLSTDARWLRTFGASKDTAQAEAVATHLEMAIAEIERLRAALAESCNERATKAEAAIERLTKERDALRAGLQRIIDHYDMRSEIYTNDADLAGGMADIARHAVAHEQLVGPDEGGSPRDRRDPPQHPERGDPPEQQTREETK